MQMIARLPQKCFFGSRIGNNADNLALNTENIYGNSSPLFAIGCVYLLETRTTKQEKEMVFRKDVEENQCNLGERL